MPKTEYPKYLFNTQGGNTLVKSAEAHQALEGEWFESPEEAKGESRAHDPRPDDAVWPGDLPKSLQNKTRVKEEYPKFVYANDGTGGTKATQVNNATQHAALGEGWYESPGEAKDALAQATIANPPNPSLVHPILRNPEGVRRALDAAGGVSADHLRAGDVTLSAPDTRIPKAGVGTPATPGGPTPEQQQAGAAIQELQSTATGEKAEDTPLDHVSMNATEAALYIGTLTSIDGLSRAMDAEEAGRNRVTVKRAIQARIETLAAHVDEKEGQQSPGSTAFGELQAQNQHPGQDDDPDANVNQHPGQDPAEDDVDPTYQPDPADRQPNRPPTSQE